MKSICHFACICFALTACTNPEVDPCEEPSFADEGATFLVSRLSIGAIDEQWMTSGFDLDGVTSVAPTGRCGDQLADHRLAPDGDLDGIDNVVAELASVTEALVGDLAADDDPLGLDAAVARGDVLLLLEIVPSIVAGEEPMLRVHHATPADGSLELDATGRPAAGQRFRGALVAQGPLSVVPTPAPLTRRSVAVLAPFAGTTADPSPAPPLDLAQLTHVGLNQCAGDGPRGRMGGSWTPEDAATWARRLGQAGSAEGLAQGVRQITDLDPDPRDPAICRRISFGLALDLVVAELVVD